MATIGLSELLVIGLAMLLPCFGFLLVGAVLIVVYRLILNKRQEDD
jgi:hypothetical protein